MLDLLVKDGACPRARRYEIATGEVHTFHAKTVLLATGGFGRMYKVTSNAYALTGDGVAIAWRRGVPLMDMEFFQFHPTDYLDFRHLGKKVLERETPGHHGVRADLPRRRAGRRTGADPADGALWTS